MIVASAILGLLIGLLVGRTIVWAVVDMYKVLITKYTKTKSNKYRIRRKKTDTKSY